MRAKLGWIAIGLVLVALVVLPFLLVGPEVERHAQAWLQGGGRGALLLALAILALFAFDVVLPVPSSLVSVAAVMLFGWAGGLLIWLGMSLGCALGYWLGSRAARPLAAKFLGADELERARRLAADVGAPTLVLTRAVPVLAEVATVAAGLAAMPIRRFALATGLANAGIALVYVAAGLLAHGSDAPFAILFAAAVAVPVLAWLGFRLAGRSD